MRCPVPEKIWSPFHWPQYSYQQNVWWKFPCGREPANVFKCEVRSPSFLSSKFLGCNLQGAARCRLQVCKCFMGKAALKPDHKLHIYKHILASIHESPWHMIPIPAALVCPKVTEDACNIASHLSIDPTHNK